MSILVSVVNQKMYISSHADGLVAGSQQFVKFKFNLSEEWDGLVTFAQFQQNGKAYNQYLDDDCCAYLPAEIGVGTCTMMLYGVYDTTIGTTNYLTLKIEKNNLVSNAESTDISQSLYNQLITQVRAMAVSLEQKANSSDLEEESARAESMWKKLQFAIDAKASQVELDELSEKVHQLSNNGTVTELVESSVANELERYLNSGKLANMTIVDKSISRSKVDNDFEATLKKADFSAPVIIATASGSDQADCPDSLVGRPLRRLHVYGHTNLIGTPTMDTPAQITNDGDGGTVLIETVTDTVEISAPGGLAGLHTSKNGNFTDENGQQWWSDSIEHQDGSAALVRRVRRLTLTGDEAFSVGYFPAIGLGTPSPYYVNTNAEIICNYPLKIVSADSSGHGLAFQLNTVQFPSAAAFTNWVKERYQSGAPVVVYYGLQTPVTEQLTDSEVLALTALTMSERKIVYGENNEYFVVDYVADTKAYIDRVKVRNNDGIIIQDTGDGTEYLAKLRIVDGYPAMEITEL